MLKRRPPQLKSRRRSKEADARKRRSVEGPN
jgi:hypothetical protein